MSLPTANPILQETFLAEADLSAKRYLTVKAGTADGSMILASSAGEVVLGILQDKPADTVVGAVCTMGLCVAEAGAAFSYGDPLQTDADGQLITALTGDFVVAWARQAAAAAGDQVTVFVVPNVPLDA